jgi:hypothetical protein
VIEPRVVEPGDEMRCTRPGSGDADAEFAGELCVRRRHKRCHFLVPHLDEFDLAFGALLRAEHPIDAVAGIPVDPPYTPLIQALNKEIADGCTMSGFSAAPKERAIRRRQLKRLWARLKQLSTMEISREELLMKLGGARDQSRSAWRLAVIEVAADSATFSYRLDRHKLRQARSREGRYLLRTNLVEEDPAKLWSHYLLLVAVEEAFKNPKGDLAIRLIFHQLEARIEAHVFIAFLAYCLHVTLARRCMRWRPG